MVISLALRWDLIVVEYQVQQDAGHGVAVRPASR